MIWFICTKWFTEASHRVGDEMEIEVAVAVFQRLDSNDEIHFHYVHVRIVHENASARDLHDVVASKIVQRNGQLSVHFQSKKKNDFTWSGLAASANDMGSNRELLANINAINSRSRDKLCIASRLAIDGDECDCGGPDGCNSGPPWERPEIMINVILWISLRYKKCLTWKWISKWHHRRWL